MLLQLLISAAAAAQQLPPVDECSADPSLIAFRAELASAVERRDPEALLALVAEDVQADLGGGEGKALFVDAWGLDDPSESALWEELAEALSLGCAASGDALVAPSMMVQLDPMADAYETVIAVAPGAVLRTAPSEDSAVLAQLQWDVMTVTSWPADGDYMAVQLSDGRKGYVRHDAVRSPVDYRAVFEQVGGEWRITSFLAGD